jgi:rare lipoprotein A (peptidoglycan hydrolase)
MRWWGMNVRMLSPMSVVILVLPVGSALAASGGTVRNPAARMAQERVEYGTASWYGPGFQGRRMATGRPFNEDAMTAAHRTLPLGTTVLVTNLLNGRSVIVSIMDRGPMIATRLIDLSRAAAIRLGFVDRGLTRVKVEVVSVPSATPHRALPSPGATEARLHVDSGR